MELARKTIKIYVVKSTKMYTDSELSGHNSLLRLVVTERYSETGFFTPKSCYPANPARLIHWPPLTVPDIVLESLTILNLELLTRSKLKTKSYSSRSARLPTRGFQIKFSFDQLHCYKFYLLKVFTKLLG